MCQNLFKRGWNGEKHPHFFIHCRDERNIRCSVTLALPTEGYLKYTGSAGQRSCRGCFSTRHSFFVIQKTDKRYEHSQRLPSLHASVILGHEGKRLCQRRLYVRKSIGRHTRFKLKGLRLLSLVILRLIITGRVCVHVSVHVCVRVSMCLFVYVRALAFFMYACNRVYMGIYVSVCKGVYLNVWYVLVCVCMCICVPMNEHVRVHACMLLRVTISYDIVIFYICVYSR